MFDLDDFKSYNDTFGESAGDELLGILGGILTGVTRTYDVVGRHGGGAFTVLLPSTDRSDACRIADRLRMTLVNHERPMAGSRPALESPRWNHQRSAPWNYSSRRSGRSARRKRAEKTGLCITWS